MHGNPVYFYFDFLSPYAYIAWTQIHALAHKYQRSVQPTPILFGALLKHWGQRAPIEHPARRNYIFCDALRTATRLRVPLFPPKIHPFNPLLALRTCLVVKDQPQRQKLLIDKLFASVWAGGPGIIEPEVIRLFLNELELDGTTILQQTENETIKLQLRNNTEQAIDQNIFGVPSLVVDGELFWGFDSFSNLEGFLGGNLKWDREIINTWNQHSVHSVKF